MCVYYCSTYYKAVREGGVEDMCYERQLGCVCLLPQYLLQNCSRGVYLLLQYLCVCVFIVCVYYCSTYYKAVRVCVYVFTCVFITAVPYLGYCSTYYKAVRVGTVR